MDDLMVRLLQEWVLGVCLGIAVFFLYRMQNIHKDERKEWRDQSERQHDHLTWLTRDTHTLLTEIKAMIISKK